jgi:allophanate hydrolase
MNLTELRQRYQSGLSPRDLVGEILGRIASWDDPALFIHLPEREVLMEIARAVEGMPRGLPLWGVPFVVKDNIDVAGWPTTAGCPDYTYVPNEDAEVVRLLRAAGAIPIGKANLDQFATGLVGTRSPYGVPRNAIAPGWLPGGSSSGSASAVAAGMCVFSLGTDTAGSGRVPAAFQELIGWKPSKGLLSTRGVVPACRSLDCVSVFANSIQDVVEIREVVSAYDDADPYSRRSDEDRFPGRRIGVFANPDFAGDPDTPSLFADAVARFQALGYDVVEVDGTPLLEAAKLLYEGPWVAERWAAVGDFVKQHPDSVFPATRRILENSKGWDAAATFRAQDKLRSLARDAENLWQNVDFLLLPTTPRLYQVSEVLYEPFQTNATLGRYTNFMNLLDLSAVAIPAGRARDGAVPWGVTLAAPAFSDAGLLEIAAEFSDETCHVVPHGWTRVLVCGAHMDGLPLNWQLRDRQARLLCRTNTAPSYRLFAMPGNVSLPPRPAMIHDQEYGSAIEVEIWTMPTRLLGSFVEGIPEPLGIGKVLLNDGSRVTGFIAEPRATDGAEEITRFGGWRNWLAARNA